MLQRILRPFWACTFLVLLGSTVSAQTPARPPAGVNMPSPAELQKMLQADPSLIQRMQQMMSSSGMTPDQIRSRLREQGYPEGLLDAYLGGGTLGDSLALPSENVFAAVKNLGLADTALVDSLSNVVSARRAYRAARDSAFRDTVERALRNDSTREAIRSLLQSREQLRSFGDSGFKQFGLDLFSRDTKLFEANVNGPVDVNYRFGVDDRIVVVLTGEVQKSYQVTVTRSGFVAIPEAGLVNAAGLTRTQLEDVLYDRLKRVYSGLGRSSDSRVRLYVDVSRLGANQVSVNGDVAFPSNYRIPRGSTVMSALYVAGGPTPAGSMRNVQVLRNGTLVGTMDVYDYALKGSGANDIRLENGDVVFVPPRGPQVRVAGAVMRPATYEAKEGQTVADVIALAGGFSEAADRRRIQIQRIVPPNERGAAGTDRRFVDVPSDLFSNAPIRAGDIIRVTPIAERVANRVVVTGNVWSPGPIGFTPGMKLSDALRSTGGVKPDSYLGEVLVTRLRPDSTREALRTALFDTTGRAQNDIVLRDADEIQVFSTTEFRPNRYITVDGAVRKPGKVPFRDGMTMRDAVLLAGGPTESASLTTAEIARLPENRAAGVIATTSEAPLDSSYLFGHGPAGNPANDVVLRPYDAILIKRQPEWQLNAKVYLDGEVRYPGPYALVSTTDKLSDLLKRAGGLTTAAYPDGIVFIRKRNAVGRVGVNLSEVLRDDKSIDNLQLIDGDSIFIPKYTTVVTVRGAVQSQVGVAYVPGADIDYYIRSAGGATSKGDRGRAYVTQPNGKVDSRESRLGFFHSTPHPQAGSTVVVPVRDPADNRDWLQIATAVASITGSLVAIVAVLRR